MIYYKYNGILHYKLHSQTQERPEERPPQNMRLFFEPAGFFEERPEALPILLNSGEIIW